MSDNSVILTIGGVDMRYHVICEALKIQTSPVFSNGFTAVNGKERKQCLGDSVSLSADFQVLDGQTAGRLIRACRDDTVAVTYKEPGTSEAVTVNFDRPVVSYEPVFEDGITSYWNISVSMTCPLKGDGL